VFCDLLIFGLGLVVTALVYTAGHRVAGIALPPADATFSLSFMACHDLEEESYVPCIDSMCLTAAVGILF
jgi:hypothetical protein